MDRLSLFAHSRHSRPGLERAGVTPPQAKKARQIQQRPDNPSILPTEPRTVSSCPSSLAQRYTVSARQMTATRLDVVANTTPPPLPITDLGQHEQSDRQIDNFVNGRQIAGAVNAPQEGHARLAELPARRATSTAMVAYPGGGWQLLFWRSDSPHAARLADEYKNDLHKCTTLFNQNLQAKADTRLLKAQARYNVFSALTKLVNGDASFQAERKNLYDHFTAVMVETLACECRPLLDHSPVDHIVANCHQRVHSRLLNFSHFEQLVGHMRQSLESQAWYYSRWRTVPIEQTLRQAIWNNPTVKAQVLHLKSVQKSDIPTVLHRIIDGVRDQLEGLEQLRRELRQSARAQLDLPPAEPVPAQSSWSGYVSRLVRGSGATDPCALPCIDAAAVKPEQHDRAAILQQLDHWIDKEKTLVLQAATDPALTLCAGSLTWNAAIEFKRLGYRFDADLTRMSALTDKALKEREGEQLGRGAFHTAIRLNYSGSEPGDPQQGRAVSRIFKAIAHVDRSLYSRAVGNEHYLDVSTPHFIARNMAVHIIATQLQMDLVPECEFAIHNAQLGLLMTPALGHRSNGPDLEKLFDNPHRESAQTTVLRQLNDLEWLDALCSQSDRHCNNIMICPQSGRVTGIDNDVALYPFEGIIAASQTDQNRSAASKRQNIRREDKISSTLRAGCRIGYPLLIDSHTLTQIQQLDITALLHRLRPHLNDNERQALATRHRLLKEHATALQKSGFVVDNWQTWRDTEQRSVTSYLAGVDSKKDVCRATCEHELQQLRQSGHGQRMSPASGSTAAASDSEAYWRYVLCHNTAITLKLGMATSYLATFLDHTRTDQKTASHC